MAYFSTAEFRAAMSDMSDTSRYPDAKVERARDWVEALIERVCDTSFVARARTETFDGDGTREVVLGTPYVLGVTSASVDGAPLAGADLTGLTFAAGILKRPHAGGAVWTSGVDNVVVAYTAGYSAAPPADLKEAAMVACRYRVLGGSQTSGLVSERATSLTNEFGNVQFSVAATDRPTGLPEVDATIMGWAAKVRWFGVS